MMSPSHCRDYVCTWLVDGSVPDHWRPLTAKMFIDLYSHGTPPRIAMRVHVHPKYPNRWREQPWYGDLKIWAARMLARKPPIDTIVTVYGGDTYQVLPDGDLKIEKKSTIFAGHGEAAAQAPNHQRDH